MANLTAKTSSNIFYKARCEAATHNEQLSSREGAADYAIKISLSFGRIIGKFEFQINYSEKIDNVLS